MNIHHKGERLGEYRRYGERLTMFLLRYRDPLRYAKSLDKAECRGHQEGAAYLLWQSFSGWSRTLAWRKPDFRALIDEALGKLDRVRRPGRDFGGDVP